MAVTQQRKTLVEKRTFSKPEDTRKFEKGSIELVTVNGVNLGRATFEPGWRWSTHVKPIVNTESCQTAHLTFVISGRIHLQMDDGTEMEFGPGDAAYIPPGHDAWVVGNEKFVAIDINGLENYAVRPKVA